MGHAGSTVLVGCSETPSTPICASVAGQVLGIAIESIWADNQTDVILKKVVDSSHTSAGMTICGRGVAAYALWVAAGADKTFVELVMPFGTFKNTGIAEGGFVVKGA